MTLEEKLQSLATQNDALITSEVKPDMGPVNAASNLPDEQTFALQKLQQQNDMLLEGKSESTGSVFLDYLAGFNYSAAKAIPPLLNAIGSVFTPGMKELFPSTKVRDDIILDAMHSIGIEAKNIDTLSNKIGRQNFHDLLLAAATIAGAPVAAGAVGAGAVPTTLRTVGSTIMQRPVLAAAETLGAGAGQQIAQEVAPGSTMAELGGAVAGGLAVSGAAAVGGKAVNAVTKAIPGLAPKGPALAPDAIRPIDADPEAARVFAEQALDGAKTTLQKAVDDAVEAVPRTGTSEQTQSALRASIDRAERIGNRIVSTFWARVPLKNPVPMSGLRRELGAFEAELADTPSAIPRDSKGQSFIERLGELASPIRDPATGQMRASLPTIQRLRDFRGEIRVARKTMEASPAPNDAMIRNYNRMESMIDETIQRAYPQDRAIDQARKVSIMYHDLFSRGAIADVTARRARGDAIVPPEQTTEKLMGRFGGIQDVVDVRNKLVYQRRAGGGGFAVSPAERTQLQQLTTDAENSIRAMFRDAAENQGPEAAAKFVGKHQKTIEALSKVHAELAMAEQKITAALRSQKNLETSAIAKYASNDPKYSFKRIIANANPSATAKEVLLTLKNDPQALAGFQASAVDDLLTRTKGDPIRMRNYLSDTRIDKLYRTVLGDAGFDRLTRNTDIAYRIAIGDEKFTSRHLIGRATLLGRILGAQAGRITSQMLGGGTIQVPGIMANSFGRAVERFFRTANPQDLLIQSIVDPKWERLLLTREPKTTLEGRKALKAMRRSLTAIEFTQQRAHDALANENEE